jgi:uncharacterized protein (DUF169 family)
MRPLQTDLSIYRQFNFERPPVGVTYLIDPPLGIQKLDKNLALCEMLKESQQSQAPFYVGQENENCMGKKMVGMDGEEGASSLGSGQIGVEFGIFQDNRANWRLYQYLPRIKNAANYIAFSPLDKMTLEPDLLILMGTVSQAEIVMRAMSFSTGEKWSSQLTGVAACSWIFAYPFLTGKVNFIITGMGFGMKAKQVFPEGLILISIPFDWIPTITQNLKEIKWVLPAYTDGREKFLEREKEILKKVV